MTFFQPDVGVVLRFPCTVKRARLDLTDATLIELLVENNPQSPFIMTKDPIQNNVATYTVLDGDFDVAANYNASVRVTFSPTQKFHSRTFKLRALELFS